MLNFKKTMIAAFVASSVFSLSGCLDSSSDSDNTPATDPLADAAAAYNTALLVVTNATGSALTTANGAFNDADYGDTVTLGTDNPLGLKSTAWTNDWTVGIHEADTHANFANKWTKTASNGACSAGTLVAGYAADFVTELQGVDVCRLPSDIAADATLSADDVYLLADGGTRVGDGNDADGGSTPATLTIEPGTLVLGEDGDYLLITRGSQIDAQGTAAAPIYFRSAAWAKDEESTLTSDANKLGYGTWGGVVLQGKGIDFSGTNVQGEGGVEYYAGTDNTDNSGTMTYVVISGAGDDIDGNGNELNALTLQGVGSATTISHIQLDKTLDDAIEFFGGSVDVTNLALTNVGDDAFDADNGFNGSADTVYIKMSAEWSIGGPGESRGIEADGYDPKDSSGNKFIEPSTTSENTTDLVLSNFTIVGSGDVDYTDSGMVLRRGVKVDATNFLVIGFPDSGIEFRDRGTLEEGTVSSYDTGATTWDGTYGRINLTNVAFQDTGKTIKLEMFKDEKTHLDNIYDSDEAQDALDAWFADQTNVKFYE